MVEIQTEITDKEEWLCWRKTQEQDNPENERNTETSNVLESTKTKIKITLKQAKLTDLYNKQQTPESKTEKITTRSTETEKRKQEITRGKNNKNKDPSTNNANKKKPNNIGGKTNKHATVLRKPVLPDPNLTNNKKPVEENNTINNKITRFFTRNHQEMIPEKKPKIKIPEKPTNVTTIPKPPKPKKTNQTQVTVPEKLRKTKKRKKPEKNNVVIG